MAARTTAPAERDIVEITRFIARRDRLAARRWSAHVKARIERLGEMPGCGAPRFEIAPTLRIIPVGSYNILYRHVGEDAVILRIVHGARRWDRLVR